MINANHFQKPNELNRNILLTPDKKVLYFSIPKCACSTVKVFLRTLYGQNPREARRDPHSFENLPLLSYNDLDGDEELTALIKDESIFKFSIIRDPRSRVISAYKNKFIDAPVEKRRLFLQQIKVSKKEYLEGEKQISFIKFLRRISNQTSFEMNEHWRPMASQLLGLSPKKVELFDIKDVSLALKKIEYSTGIKNKTETPNLNFSPHTTKSTKFHSELSQKEISLISKIYRDDLYLYLYKTSYFS